MFQTELLIRVKESDQQAYKDFFDLYASRVYRFFYRYIKSKTEVEDLTQNVFLKLWEKRAMIDPEKPAEGLIFVIARNLMIDHFRATARRIKETQWWEDLVDTVPSTHQADELTRYNQISQIYHKAINLLPPRRKDIFTMSRHEGLSNKEIAEKMGISVKTVENQMTEALSFIREFLAKEDVAFTLFIIFLLNQ